MKKAVIIGAGLGGLQCGYILAQNGYEVTILEKHSQAGGCLQSFRRKGFSFDTGFHYVGGMGEGESLHRLFEYFHLLDLQWVRMDNDCFDEVVIGDESFSLASGYDSFVETLAQRFPSERRGLERYVATLKNIGEHIFDVANDPINEAFETGAYAFLTNTIGDPLLRKVLSGSSLKMNLCAETLPLYVFAQINNSFIQSSWRLKGGGTALVQSLENSIRESGGTVLTKAEVTALKEENGMVKAAEINGEELLEADVFLSDLHPDSTLSLIDATGSKVRPIYRKRIAALRNAFGMFTANILLKPGKMNYLNRNVFVHSADEDLWHPSLAQTRSVMVHFYPETYPDGSARAIDLLSPMDMSLLEKWTDTTIGHRGDEYEKLKAQKAQACIDHVAKRFPELKDAIDSVFTSTPLTYLDYTGTPDGSAYGICKDFNNPAGTIISPQTSLPNLFLTGQNLNLHGILGTSITSFLTAAAVIGQRPSFPKNNGL